MEFEYNLRVFRRTLILLLTLTLAMAPVEAKNKSRKKGKVPPSSLTTTCPENLSQFGRRALLLGGIATALSAGGLTFHFLNADSTPDLILVGERHDSSDSDKRRKELRALAKAGKIILAEENELFDESLPALENSPIFGFPFKEHRGDHAHVEGLEHSLPHSVAVFDVSKKTLVKYLLSQRVKNAPPEFRAMTLYEEMNYFRSLFGEETTLSALNDMAGDPEVFRNSATAKKFPAVDADKMVAHFQILYKAVQDPAVGKAWDSMDRRVFKKGQPVELILKELRKLPSDFVSSFQTAEGLVTLIAIDEALTERVRVALEKAKEDVTISPPEEVLTYFKNYPSLSNSLEDYLKPPYAGLIHKPLALDWRNVVMYRRIETLVDKSNQTKKPLYIILGDAHVDGIEEAVKKGGFPPEKLKREKSYR